MNALALDIETVPVGLTAPSAQDAGAVYVDGEAVDDEAVKRFSLDASSARIVCIALTAFQTSVRFQDALVVFGDSEKVVLQEFWRYIGENKSARLITHNGLSFDLPFIWKRSIIKCVKPSMTFDLARYRTTRVYDTMQMWANWNPRDFISLDNLARVLGFGGKTGNGGQVHKLWLQEKYNEVALYCLQDAILTYACFCRMNFLEPPDQKQIESACRFLQVHAEQNAESVKAVGSKTYSTP